MRASKPVALSLSAALLVGIGLTGCGTHNNGQVGTQGVKNQSAHRLNITSADQAREGIRNLKYSKSLSQKVTEIGSVHTAHVMTSGSEAFVAVNLNGTNPAAGGTRASGNHTGRGVTGTGTGTGTGMNGTTGISTRGTGTGTMNIPTGPNMTAPRTHGAGNVTGTPGTLGRSMGQGVNPGGSDYRPSGTAGSIGGLDYNGGVSGGTNLRGGYRPNPATIYDGSRLGGGLGVQANNNTNRTGTNGAGNGLNTLGTNNTNNTNSNIPANVRTEIEQTIKRAAPQIQNVYISDDGDFMNQMSNFGTNGPNMTLGNNPLTNGARNIAGDLGNMIDRLFPHRNTNINNTTNTNNTGTNGFRTNTTGNRFDMNPNR